MAVSYSQKRLALWFTMNRFRNHTSLKVLYLNGMTAKAKVDLDIRGDRYTDFTAVLKELIGYEGTLKLYEKGRTAGTEIWTSFFPKSKLPNRTVSLLFFLRM